MITLFEAISYKDGRGTLHYSYFTFRDFLRRAFKDVAALFSALLVGLMGCNIARLSFFLRAVKRFRLSNLGIVGLDWLMNMEVFSCFQTKLFW